MKSEAELCKLPSSEINAVVAAIDEATTIMASGANDDAVAFNQGGQPSSRMENSRPSASTTSTSSRKDGSVDERNAAPVLRQGTKSATPPFCGV